MSRIRRLRERCARGSRLLAVETWRTAYFFGCSAQEIEWRVPLRGGPRLPFWRGICVLAPAGVDLLLKGPRR